MTDPLTKREILDTRSQLLQRRLFGSLETLKQRRADIVESAQRATHVGAFLAGALLLWALTPRPPVHRPATAGAARGLSMGGLMILGLGALALRDLDAVARRGSVGRAFRPDIEQTTASRGQQENEVMNEAQAAERDNLTGQVREKISMVVDKEQIADLDKGIRKFTRDQPVVAAVAALGVGYILGRIASRWA